MPVVCTRCSQVYEPVDNCPRCGAAVPVVATMGAPGHGPRWQQTTLGRIIIGLVLAQGLFYGLHQLFTGVLLALRDPGDVDLWADPRNVFLLHSILGFAVFIGAAFAGSGQHYGLLLGAFTGIWNGVMASVLKQHPAGEIADLGFLSQPLLQAVIGGLGGLIGSWVWRPISVGTAGSVAHPKKVTATKKSPLLAGPVAWVRVLLGSACVVAGTLFAAKLFWKMLDLGGDVLGTTDDLQDRIIIWQIKGFLVILGAAFAGASTRNGLKQGLFVGVIASAILVGIQAPRAKDPLQMFALTVAATLSLSLAGGWFGGQVLPPVIRTRRSGIDRAPAW